MAPEQIEDRPLDGRVDVYSLGCVAFQCLTGLPPFSRATEAAVLWAHMQEKPPRVSEARPGLPAGVDAIIVRALAKTPDERFQTCGELAAALAASLEGSQTLERTREHPAPEEAPAADDAAEPPATRLRRPRRWLALIAAFLVGAAAAAAVILLGFEREPEERVVTRTQTVAPPPDELTAFDRELLRVVPPSFRESCVPVEPVAAGFDATVRCRPGQGVVRAEYSHARSGDVMQEYFRDRVVTAGVELGDDDRLPKTGTCGSPEPSLREWTARGRTGHEETDSFQLELQGFDAAERQSLIGGHVLCHPQRGRYWIEWTDQATGTYSLATGPSSEGLVGWWKVSAGPLARP